MSGILPKSIVTRWHKQGFVPPITGWLRGDLRGLTETIFNDPFVRANIDLGPSLVQTEHGDGSAQAKSSAGANNLEDFDFRMLGRSVHQK